MRELAEYGLAHIARTPDAHCCAEIDIGRTLSLNPVLVYGGVEYVNEYYGFVTPSTSRGWSGSATPSDVSCRLQMPSL